MKSKQINNNSSTGTRIDRGILQLLKIEAAKQAITIKELLEGYCVDGLDKDKSYEV